MITWYDGILGRRTAAQTAYRMAGVKSKAALNDNLHMVHLTIELPEGALASLRQDDVGFAAEMRLAAAAKWYEMRRISQGRAAEIAGIARREFIDALARFGVSPFQYEPADMIAEARR